MTEWDFILFTAADVTLAKGGIHDENIYLSTVLFTSQQSDFYFFY